MRILRVRLGALDTAIPVSAHTLLELLVGRGRTTIQHRRQLLVIWWHVELQPRHGYTVRDVHFQRLELALKIYQPAEALVRVLLGSSDRSLHLAKEILLLDSS